MKPKTKTIRVPTEVWSLLRKAAFDRGTSMSQLIERFARKLKQ